MTGRDTTIPSRLRAIPRALGWRRLVSGGLSALLPSLAIGNPTGGEVVAGIAAISNPEAGTTVIDQASNSAVINWQTFSIGGQEFVIFNQPSASSVALNRVLGGDPSEILGNLSANGRVFLVNPMGVLFGDGARVDVGGLVATTMDIADEDFLAGNYAFAGNSPAAVRNDGVIAANNGFVVLSGDHVSNTGLIESVSGSVILAAAGGITLDIDNSGLVSYTLDTAALSELAGVENLGQILADGGAVVLAANVAESLVANTVNNSGQVRARGIEDGPGGSILLSAEGGSIHNSGVLDASGARGGEIHLVAEHDLTLTGDSEILATGQGPASGGFVELSAHRDLRLGALPRIGRGGTLYIDPVDLTLANGARPASPEANTVYEQDVEATLQSGGNVILDATNSITVANLADDVLNGYGQSNGTSFSAGGSLTLGIGSQFSNSFVRGPGSDSASALPTGIFFDDQGDKIQVDGSLDLIAGSSAGNILAGHLVSGGNPDAGAPDFVLDGGRVRILAPGNVTLGSVRGRSIEIGAFGSYGGDPVGSLHVNDTLITNRGRLEIHATGTVATGNIETNGVPSEGGIDTSVRIQSGASVALGNILTDASGSTGTVNASVLIDGAGAGNTVFVGDVTSRANGGSSANASVTIRGNSGASVRVGAIDTEAVTTSSFNAVADAGVELSAFGSTLEVGSITTRAAASVGFSFSQLQADAEVSLFANAPGDAIRITSGYSGNILTAATETSGSGSNAGKLDINATAYGGGNITLGNLSGADGAGKPEALGIATLRGFAGSTSTSGIGGSVTVNDVLRDTLIVQAANFRGRDVTRNSAGLNIAQGGNIVFRDLVAAGGGNIGFQSANHNFRVRSITTTGNIDLGVGAGFIGGYTDGVSSAESFGTLTANSISLGGAGGGSIAVGNLTATGSGSYGGAVRLDAGSSAAVRVGSVTGARFEVGTESSSASPVGSLTLNGNVTIDGGPIVIQAAGDVIGGSDTATAADLQTRVGGGIVRFGPGSITVNAGGQVLLGAVRTNVNLGSAGGFSNGRASISAGSALSVREISTHASSSSSAFASVSVNAGGAISVGAISARADGFPSSATADVTVHGNGVGDVEVGTVQVTAHRADGSFGNARGNVSLSASGGQLRFESIDLDVEAFNLTPNASVSLDGNHATQAILGIGSGNGRITTSVRQTGTSGGDRAHDITIRGFGGGDITVGDITNLGADGKPVTVATANLRTFSGSHAETARGGAVTLGDVTLGTLHVNADSLRARDLQFGFGSWFFASSGSVNYRDLTVTSGADVFFVSPVQRYGFRSISTAGNIRIGVGAGSIGGYTDGVGGAEEFGLTTAGGDILLGSAASTSAPPQDGDIRIGSLQADGGITISGTNADISTGVLDTGVNSIGGAVRLTTTNGSITVGADGNADSFTAIRTRRVGSGGDASVLLDAGGDLTVHGAIRAAHDIRGIGEANANAAISLTAGGPQGIHTGNLETTADGQSIAAFGSIEATATGGAIRTGDITAYAGGTSAASSVSATVDLTAGSGSVRTGGISATENIAPATPRSPHVTVQASGGGIEINGALVTSGNIFLQALGPVAAGDISGVTTAGLIADRHTVTVRTDNGGIDITGSIQAAHGITLNNRVNDNLVGGIAVTGLMHASDGFVDVQAAQDVTLGGSVVAFDNDADGSFTDARIHITSEIGGITTGRLTTSGTDTNSDSISDVNAEIFVDAAQNVFIGGNVSAVANAFETGGSGFGSADNAASARANVNISAGGSITVTGSVMTRATARAGGSASSFSESTSGVTAPATAIADAGVSMLAGGNIQVGQVTTDASASTDGFTGSSSASAFGAIALNAGGQVDAGALQTQAAATHGFATATIHVDAFGGGITIGAGSGNVLTDARGDTSAGSVQGDIRLAASGGNVRAGDLTGQETALLGPSPASPDVTVTATGGQIDVGAIDAPGNVLLTALGTGPSGGVETGAITATDHSITVITDNGNVLLDGALTAGTGINVQNDRVDGTVDVNGTVANVSSGGVRLVAGSSIQAGAVTTDSDVEVLSTTGDVTLAGIAAATGGSLRDITVFAGGSLSLLGDLIGAAGNDGRVNLTQNGSGVLALGEITADDGITIVNHGGSISLVRADANLDGDALGELLLTTTTGDLGTGNLRGQRVVLDVDGDVTVSGNIDTDGGEVLIEAVHTQVTGSTVVASGGSGGVTIRSIGPIAGLIQTGAIDAAGNVLIGSAGASDSSGTVTVNGTILGGADVTIESAAGNVETGAIDALGDIRLVSAASSVFVSGLLSSGGRIDVEAPFFITLRDVISSQFINATAGGLFSADSLSAGVGARSNIAAGIDIRAGGDVEVLNAVATHTLGAADIAIRSTGGGHVSLGSASGFDLRLGNANFGGVTGDVTVVGPITAAGVLDIRGTGNVGIGALQLQNAIPEAITLDAGGTLGFSSDLVSSIGQIRLVSGIGDLDLGSFVIDAGAGLDLRANGGAILGSAVLINRSASHAIDLFAASGIALADADSALRFNADAGSGDFNATTVRAGLVAESDSDANIDIVAGGNLTITGDASTHAFSSADIDIRSTGGGLVSLGSVNGFDVRIGNSVFGGNTGDITVGGILSGEGVVLLHGSGNLSVNEIDTVARHADTIELLAGGSLSLLSDLFTDTGQIRLRSGLGAIDLNAFTLDAAAGIDIDADGGDLQGTATLQNRSSSHNIDLAAAGNVLVGDVDSALGIVATAGGNFVASSLRAGVGSASNIDANINVAAMGSIDVTFETATHDMSAADIDLRSTGGGNVRLGSVSGFDLRVGDAVFGSFTNDITVETLISTDGVVILDGGGNLNLQTATIDASGRIADRIELLAGGSLSIGSDLVSGNGPVRLHSGAGNLDLGSFLIDAGAGIDIDANGGALIGSATLINRSGAHNIDIDTAGGISLDMADSALGFNADAGSGDFSAATIHAGLGAAANSDANINIVAGGHIDVANEAATHDMSAADIDIRSTGGGNVSLGSASGYDVRIGNSIFGSNTGDISVTGLLSAEGIVKLVGSGNLIVGGIDATLRRADSIELRADGSLGVFSDLLAESGLIRLRSGLGALDLQSFTLDAAAGIDIDADGGDLLGTATLLNRSSSHNIDLAAAGNLSVGAVDSALGIIGTAGAGFAAGSLRAGVGSVSNIDANVNVAAGGNIDVANEVATHDMSAADIDLRSTGGGNVSLGSAGGYDLRIGNNLFGGVTNDITVSSSISMQGLVELHGGGNLAIGAIDSSTRLADRIELRAGGSLAIGSDLVSETGDIDLRSALGHLDLGSRVVDAATAVRIDVAGGSLLGSANISSGLAGHSIDIDAADDISLGSLESGRNVFLTAGGNVQATGILSGIDREPNTSVDVAVTAGGNVAILGEVRTHETAGADIDIQSTGLGNVTVGALTSNEIRIGSPVSGPDATRHVTITGPVNASASLRIGTVDGGDVSVQNVTADSLIEILGDQLFIDGRLQAATIDLVVAEILGGTIDIAQTSGILALNSPTRISGSSISLFGDAGIQAPADIDAGSTGAVVLNANTGDISGGTITAADFDAAADNLSFAGFLLGGTLALDATQSLSLAGASISAAEATLRGASVDLRGASLSATNGSALVNASAGDALLDGAFVNASDSINLQAAGLLGLAGATLAAADTGVTGGSVSLSAAQIFNQGGSYSGVGDFTVVGDSVDLRSSQVDFGGNVDIRSLAASLILDDSAVNGAAIQLASAHGVRALNATFQSPGTLSVNAGPSALMGGFGSVLLVDALTVNADLISLGNATLDLTGNLDLLASDRVILSGAMVSALNATFGAGTAVDLDHARINLDGALDVLSGGELFANGVDITAGSVSLAGTGVALGRGSGSTAAFVRSTADGISIIASAGSADLGDATIQSARGIGIDAAQGLLLGGASLQAGTGSDGDLTLGAQNIFNSSGSYTGGGDFRAEAAHVRLDGATINVGGNVTIDASNGTASVRNADIDAGGFARIGGAFGVQLGNTALDVGGSADLNALDSGTSGGLVADGLHGSAETLSAFGPSVNLNGASFSTRSGISINASNGGSISLAGAALDVANGNLGLDGGHIRLDGAVLDARSDELSSFGGSITLSARQDISNFASTIRGERLLAVSDFGSVSLGNAVLQLNEDLTIRALGGGIDLVGASLSARDSVGATQFVQLDAGTSLTAGDLAAEQHLQLLGGTVNVGHLAADGDILAAGFDSLDFLSANSNLGSVFLAGANIFGGAVSAADTVTAGGTTRPGDGPRGSEGLVSTGPAATVQLGNLSGNIVQIGHLTELADGTPGFSAASVTVGSVSAGEIAGLAARDQISAVGISTTIGDVFIEGAGSATVDNSINAAGDVFILGQTSEIRDAGGNVIGHALVDTLDHFSVGGGISGDTVRLGAIDDNGATTVDAIELLGSVQAGTAVLGQTATLLRVGGSVSALGGDVFLVGDIVDLGGINAAGDVDVAAATALRTGDVFGNAVQLAGGIVDLADSLIVGDSIDIDGGSVDASFATLDADNGGISLRAGDGAATLSGAQLFATDAIDLQSTLRLDLAGAALHAGADSTTDSISLQAPIIANLGGTYTAAGSFLANGSEIRLTGSLVDVGGNINIDGPGSVDIAGTRLLADLGVAVTTLGTLTASDAVVEAASGNIGLIGFDGIDARGLTVTGQSGFIVDIDTDVRSGDDGGIDLSGASVTGGLVHINAETGLLAVAASFGADTLSIESAGAGSTLNLGDAQINAGQAQLLSGGDLLSDGLQITSQGTVALNRRNLAINEFIESFTGATGTTDVGTLTGTIDSLLIGGATVRADSISGVRVLDIQSSGNLLATTLQAGEQLSTGVAGDTVIGFANAAGTVLLSGDGALRITSGLSGDSLQLAADTVDVSGTQIFGSQVSVEALGSDESGVGLNAGGAQLTAGNGTLSLNAHAGDLLASDAVLSAAGQLGIDASGALQLSRVDIGAGGNISLSGASIFNSSGSYTGSGDFSVTAGNVSLDNASITFSSGQVSLQATDGDLSLTAGVMQAGSATLDAAGNLATAGSTIQTAGALGMTAGGGVDLATARLTAGGALDIEAGGPIEAASGAARIEADTVRLSGSRLRFGNAEFHAAGDVSLLATDSLVLSGTSLHAGSAGRVGNATLTAGTGFMDLTGVSITTSGHTGIGAGSSLFGSSLSLLADSATINGGGQAGSSVSLFGAGITVSGRLSVGAGSNGAGDIFASSAAFRADSASFTAPGDLFFEQALFDISGTLALSATGNLFGAGALSLSAGELLATAAAVELGDLNVDGNARIESRLGAVTAGTVSAGSIDIVAAGSVQADQLAASGSVGVSAVDSLLLGSVRSGSADINLDAATIRSGTVSAAGSVTALAAGDIGFDAGVQATAGSLDIQSISGSVSVAGLSQGGAVTVRAGTTATLAAVQAASAIDLQAAGALQAGSITSTSGSVQLLSGGATIQTGSILAAGAVNAFGDGGIRVDGDAVSQQVSVHLRANSGNVDVTGNLSAGTPADPSLLAAIDIDASGDITVGGGASGDSVSFSAGGRLRIGGAVDATADYLRLVGQQGIEVASLTAAGHASIFADSGSVRTGNIGAGSLDLRAAQGAQLDGRSIHTTIGDASILASGGDLDFVGGELVSAGSLRIDAIAGQINLSGAQARAATELDLTAGRTGDAGFDVVLVDAVLSAPQTRISASGNVRNAGSEVSGESLSVTAQDSVLLAGSRATLSGDASYTAGNDVNLEGASISASGIGIDAGRDVFVDGAGLLATSTLGAAAGRDIHASDAQLAADVLSLTATDGTVTVDRSSVDASETTIRAGGILQLRNSTVTANRTASFEAGGELSLAGTTLNAGSVSTRSGGDLVLGNVDAGALSASVTSGNITVNENVSASRIDLSTAAGNITAFELVSASTVDLAASGTISTGAIQAGDAVSVNAATLNLGTVGTPGAITLVAAGNVSAQALNGSRVDVSGSTLELVSATGSEQITLEATDGDLTVGSLVSGGTVTVSGSENVAIGAVQSAGDVQLGAGQNLGAAAILAAGSNVQATAGDVLLLQSGSAEGGSTLLTAASATLNGENGVLLQNGSVQADTLNLLSTGIIATDNLDLAAGTVLIRNGDPSGGSVGKANEGLVQFRNSRISVSDRLDVQARTRIEAIGERSLIQAGGLAMRAGSVIDLRNAGVQVGSGTAGFGSDTALRDRVAAGSRPVSTVPNAALSAGSAIALGELSVAGGYLMLQANALGFAGSVTGSDALFVNIRPSTASGIRLEAQDFAFQGLALTADQLGNFESAFLAFGGTGFNGNVLVGETGPVNLGSASVLFLTGGEITGADQIQTTGSVVAIAPVVINTASQRDVPLDEELDPTGGSNEEIQTEESESKGGGDEEEDEEDSGTRSRSTASNDDEQLIEEESGAELALECS